MKPMSETHGTMFIHAKTEKEARRVYDAIEQAGAPDSTIFPDEPEIVPDEKGTRLSARFDGSGKRTFETTLSRLAYDIPEYADESIDDVAFSLRFVFMDYEPDSGVLYEDDVMAEHRAGIPVGDGLDFCPEGKRTDYPCTASEVRRLGVRDDVMDLEDPKRDLMEWFIEMHGDDCRDAIERVFRSDEAWKIFRRRYRDAIFDPEWPTAEDVDCEWILEKTSSEVIGSIRVRTGSDDDAREIVCALKDGLAGYESMEIDECSIEAEGDGSSVRELRCSFTAKGHDRFLTVLQHLPEHFFSGHEPLRCTEFDIGFSFADVLDGVHVLYEAAADLHHEIGDAELVYEMTEYRKHEFSAKSIRELEFGNDIMDVNEPRDKLMKWFISLWKEDETDIRDVFKSEKAWKKFQEEYEGYIFVPVWPCEVDWKSYLSDQQQ